jgi:hypothetical protein
MIQVIHSLADAFVTLSTGRGVGLWKQRRSFDEALAEARIPVSNAWYTLNRAGLTHPEELITRIELT